MGMYGVEEDEEEENWESGQDRVEEGGDIFDSFHLRSVEENAYKLSREKNMIFGRWK